MMLTWMNGVYDPIYFFTDHKFKSLIMDFEKAFKTLSDMVDRSVNYLTYTESKRYDYHNLAYKYKQAINSFAIRATSIYAESDIRNFEDKLSSFEHNFCDAWLYRPWKEEE